VLYTIEPDYILIIAVMHCHREPGYWKTRIP
ncbi:MAG: type II toxin-antitoxin system RelE/ParE family toxin, partial [Pseudomonadota bacterium]